MAGWRYGQAYPTHGKVSSVLVATVAKEAGFTFSAAEKDANGNPHLTEADMNCDLVVAVAVAWEESSFVTDVRNSIGASGLWQILQSAHEDLFRKDYGDNPFLAHGPDQWKNPLNNAMMAKDVFDAASGWGPWVAYPASDANLRMALKAVNVLAHKGFLGEAGLTEVTPGGAVVDAAGGVNNLLSSPIDKALAWLAQAGMTAGAFILAILLIILGIWALVSQTKVGKTATSLATSAVPGAAIAKKVKG